MTSLRVGTDRKIIWSIRLNGADLDLSTADSVSFYVSAHGRRMAIDPADYILDGNSIIWDFRGAEQHYTGPYSLTCVINEGKKGMLTFDKCDAFALVDCSCKETGPNSEDIVIDELNIDSAIGFYNGQGGAIPDENNSIPDWNAAEGEKGFIKNKPFYDNGVIEENYFESVCSISSTVTFWPQGLKYFKFNIDGNNFDIDLSGKEIPGYNGDKDVQDKLTFRYDFDPIEVIIDFYINGGGEFTIDVYCGAVNMGTPDLVTVLITECSVDRKQISEKFIPDSIARTEETDHLMDEVVALWESMEKVGAVYIPDFTIEQIHRAVENKQSFRVDTQELWSAVESGRTILVRESLDYPGLNVCSYVLEDLLYLRILATSEIITCEFGTFRDMELHWGNISITPIYGKLMQDTPSGDPMHYMYNEAGAVYNATDGDIEKKGMYGDTIYHRAYRWYLNEIGDLTNEEMRRIVYCNQSINSRRWERIFSYMKCRTNLPFHWYGKAGFNQCIDSNRFVNGGCHMDVETLVFPPYKDGEYTNFDAPISTFFNSQKLKKILNPFIFNESPNNVGFLNCFALEEFRLKDIKFPLDLRSCQKLSLDSVIYMIENENATSVITISLHSDVYSEAMGRADMEELLQQHPNVTLSY